MRLRSVWNVVGGVRGLRQPTGPVYILFSLRAQFSCAFRVEDRHIQCRVIQNHRFEFQHQHTSADSRHI